MKQYTKKTKWREETQMDRLSDLPDSLIHHILSFMNAKYAVQTCILSKRWVRVWTHLPVLKLDSKLFNRVFKFRSFISHVLDHCETSNILTLSICARRMNLGQPLFNKIVSFAVSHSVQELDLSLARYEGDLERVFRCQSLRVLKLEKFLFYRIPLPNSIGLASLKTLILCRVLLKSENHFYLFSSCLNLQNLVLDGVYLTISDIFNISAPALVNLTISPYGLHFPNISKFVITAPRLTSFCFRCYRPVSLSMDNSPFLENVNLGMFYDFPYARGEGSFMLLIDMLRQVGNARSLTLSSDLVEFLSQHARLLKEQPFPFSKLESLKVVESLKVGRRRRSFTNIPPEVMNSLKVGRRRRGFTNIPPEVMDFLVQGSPMADEVLAKFQKACSRKRGKCKQPMPYG